MHIIKTQKCAVSVLKIDLSNAYDKVSWLYLWLVLIHIRFGLPTIKWIMVFVTTISFVVLINGYGSPFFKVGQGIQQGYPLLSYLFLLIADGLSCTLFVQEG
jgi:hypothetical protein